MKIIKDLNKRATYLPPALPPKEYAGFTVFILRKAAWVFIIVAILGTLALLPK